MTKIAILSDIHDNLTNLRKCLFWCKKNNIQIIFCCGDVTNSETLKFLSDNFLGDIHLIKGNADIYDDEKINNFDNIKYYGRIANIKIDNINFGLCHEPFFIKKLSSIIKKGIIFYGHTHKPWEENKNNLKMVNPGTLSGMFSNGTFAVFNTENKKLELKILQEI